METFGGEIGLNFTASCVDFTYVMLVAEFSEIDSGLVEPRFGFENVKEGLSSQFLSMWAQQNIIFSFFCQSIYMLYGHFEVKVLKQGCSEMSKAILVRVLLAKDDGEAYL